MSNYTITQKELKSIIGENHFIHYGVLDDHNGELFATPHGKANAFYGKHHTEETKRVCFLARIGKKHTKEAKRKISLSQKGRKHTEETKEKLRILNTGKNHPRYGKHHTEESKRKISLSLIRYKEINSSVCF